MSKGKVCRVKITNYRKNGQTFQNLLSMRPVMDADQIYRFVIGVQFVVENNSDLNRRLIQLDKLFHLLPSKIPLRSKPTARTNGTYTCRHKHIFNVHTSQKFTGTSIHTITTQLHTHYLSSHKYCKNLSVTCMKARCIV